TAYITVVRLDRGTSAVQVQGIQDDKLHEQLLNQATELVKQAIASDHDQANPNLLPTVTSSGLQTWLGDLLPRSRVNALPANPNNQYDPMWRYYSGSLDPINGTFNALYQAPLVNLAVNPRITNDYNP